MAAGNVPDGEGHRQNGETERQGYTVKSDPELRKSCRQHCAAAPAENQPEGAQNSAMARFGRFMVPPLRKASTIGE
jgi:hypothetical protein